MDRVKHNLKALSVVWMLRKSILEVLSLKKIRVSKAKTGSKTSKINQLGNQKISLSHA